MKRTISLLIVFVLVMGLMITGCSKSDKDVGSAPDKNEPTETKDESKEDEPEDSKEPEKKEPVTLQMLIWGAPQHVDMYNELLDMYKKDNPHIELDVLTVPFGEFTEKATSMIATGNPPDITWWSEDSFAYFADKGYFMELDSAIEEWGSEWDKDDFYPSTLEAGQWKGVQYALPFSTPAPVLYYNKTLFDKAGVEYPNEEWTWEDFGKAVEKLTSGEGADKVYGADNLLDKGIEWQSLLNIIRSYGGDFMNEDRTECKMNSPESTEALKLYMSWVENGYVTKPGISAPFEQGRAAMFIGWLSFNARFEEVEGLDYDIEFLPKGPAGRRLRGGYAGLVIMKTTRHPEESFNLMKFLTSKEGITVTSRYFGPPRKSVGLSEKFLDPSTPPANKKVFIESLKYSTVTESFPERAKGNQIVQEEIEAMVAEQQSVEETLENIERRLNELLAGGSGE